MLEENVVIFVKNELKRIQRVLTSDYPECLEVRKEDEETKNRKISRDAFMKITINFLMDMDQEELADSLRSS